MGLWFLPGFVVVIVSVTLTLTHVVLVVITHRPYLRLSVLAAWLRQIGIGILFLGLGASVALPALSNGPDVGLVVVGALLAGMGGLFFIAASDPIFEPGRPALRRPPTASSEQTDPEQRADR